MTSIKNLSIIHLALIAGQIMFIAVVLVLKGQYEIILQPENDLFFFIVPGFAVMALLSSNMIFKKLLDKAKLLNQHSDKLNNYRAACIVRYALVEGPSLFAIICYYLTGNLFYIFISGFCILYLFTLRPTKEKVEMDLMIELKD
jgi:hypothetical protein